MTYQFGINIPRTNEEILRQSQETIRRGGLLGPVGGSWDNFMMSLQRDTAIGQTVQRMQYQIENAPDLENDWSWNVYRDGDIAGYENYIDKMSSITSAGQLESFKNQIDINEIHSARLEDGDAFWSRLASGIIDPVNFLPVPGSLGIGVVNGLLRSAKGGAALTALSEGGRALADPTLTPIDAALNITGGAVISGALGGLAGKININAIDKSGNDAMRVFQAADAGTKIDEIHPGMAETVKGKSRTDDGKLVELNEWIERGSDETSQDYFKRLDELNAMPELLKHYEQFSEILDPDAFMPTGVGLEKIRIRQMPYFMLKNNRFKGKLGNKMRRLADEISGPVGLFNKSNENMGGTAHSVAMSTVTHNTALLDVRDNLFRDYIDSTGADSSQVGSLFWQDVKYSLKQVRNRKAANPRQAFDSDVLDYYLSGDLRIINNREEKYLAAVEKGGAHLKTYFDYMGQAAVAANVFGVRRIEKIINEIKGNISKIDMEPQTPKTARTLKELRDRLKKSEEELKVIQDANELGQLPKAPGQENALGHFPRMPLKQAVQDGRENLIDILETHYGSRVAGDASLQGYAQRLIDEKQLFEDSMTSFTKTLKAIHGDEKKAQLIIDRLIKARSEGIDALLPLLKMHVYKEGHALSLIVPGIKENNATLDNVLKALATADKLSDQSKRGMLTDIGVSSSMRERELDIPTELIKDFIETDIETILRTYHRGMAPGIEMSRKFGDPNMDAKLQSLSDEMDAEMVGVKGEALDLLMQEKEDLLQATRELRDKVLNVYNLPDDPSSWGNRAVQTTKSWMTLALMGKAVVPALADMGRIAMSVGLRRAAGGALDRFANPDEYALGAREVRLAGEAAEMALQTRFEAMFDLSGYTPMNTAFERGVANGVNRMFMANMLSAYTDSMKRFSGAIIQSEMLELSEKVYQMWMGRAGIDDTQAKRIHEQWKRASTDGQGTKGDVLYLANTEKWDDDVLRRFFRVALATEINNAVVTPGKSEKLNFMSTNMGSLMTQFKSFGLTSTFRTFGSAMQMRDARAMNGILSMVALGYIVGWWKSPSYDDRGLLSPDRLIQAVDYSGVTGLLFEFDNMLETVSGQELGIRPMLGIESLWGNRNVVQQYGQVGGPAVSLIGDLIWSFASDNAEGDDKARAVRRLIPFNNLVWWDGLVDQMQRSAGKALED